MVLSQRHRQDTTPDLRLTLQCSGRLYNHVLYLQKQAWATEQVKLSAKRLMHDLAAEDNPHYRALTSQVAQEVVKHAWQDYTNFIKALVAYRKNPKGFKRKPRCPKYRKPGQLTAVTLKNSQFKVLDGVLIFAPILRLPAFVIGTHTEGAKLLCLRINPERSHVWFELCYDNELCKPKERRVREKAVAAREAAEQKTDSAGKRIILDLNLSGIAMLDDTKADTLPFYVISTGPMKAQVHLRNKKSALWQGRNGRHDLRQRLNHEKKFERRQGHMLHCMANFLVAYAKDAGAKYILVGRNKDWKQGSNMGKRNNQAFGGFPFAKLLLKLHYKCRRVGLVLQLTEESYTSKIDHLALEPMAQQETYLGRRVHRGLFRSSTGRDIHADLNGCIGIGRACAPCTNAR